MRRQKEKAISIQAEKAAVCGARIRIVFWILASFDPVAVDQACIDLVYSAEDGASLINRIESKNGLHTLEQAEKIGLGSRAYQLVSIDK